MAKIRGELFHSVAPASGVQTISYASREGAVRHRRLLDVSNNVVSSTATGATGAEVYNDYMTVTPGGSVAFSGSVTSILAALSVSGRSGNTEGVTAAITASVDHGVLRRSGAAISFGAINLASADAVSGSLPWANLNKATSSLVDLATRSITDTTGDLPWARVDKTISSLADLATKLITDTTGNLPWARVDKTVSSLADITTRSITDTTGNLPWARVDKAISSLADITTRSITDTTGNLPWARVDKSGSALGDIIAPGAAGALLISDGTTWARNDGVSYSSSILGVKTELRVEHTDGGNRVSFSALADGGTLQVRDGSGAVRASIDGTSAGNSYILSNLGLGDTNPTAKLDMYSNSEDVLRMRLYHNSANTVNKGSEIELAQTPAGQSYLNRIYLRHIRSSASGNYSNFTIVMKDGHGNVDEGLLMYMGGYGRFVGVGTDTVGNTGQGGLRVAGRSEFLNALILTHITEPATLHNGHLWTTTAGLFVRINGVTKTVTTT